MRKPNCKGMERSPLPPLYAAWMGELLPGPIPRETDATCDDCAMWPGPGDRPRSDLFFLPETKCCTYIPTLPNYLVGRILQDRDPACAAARATVEERIDTRIGVTPVGLASPPVHSLLYQHGHQLAFGRSRRLRCPHYREETGGQCGIWRHRNATCATWFCKHVRGAVGRRFWQALDQLLSITERVLGRWCLLEPRLEPQVLHRLFPPGTDRVQAGSLDGNQIDGVVREEDYRRAWGSWAGKEREFYAQAAARVNRLAWPDVIRLGGSDLRLYAALVADRYRDLASRHINNRLVAGPFHILSTGTECVRVVGYSGLDPLDLSVDLFAVLPYFDGSPTRRVLWRIREERGLRLDADLLQRLADFEILSPIS